MNKNQYIPIEAEQCKGINPIDCTLMIEQVTYDPLLDEAIKSCTKAFGEPVTVICTADYQEAIKAPQNRPTGESESD